MVSRRNYFVITVLMCVIFFMFQFTNVVLESWDGYEKNPYARKREELYTQNDAYRPGENQNNISGEPRDFIAYVGDREENIGKTVGSWAAYTKKNVKYYDSLDKYERAFHNAEEEKPKMLIIGREGVGWDKEGLKEQLKEYLEAEISLVFGSLPDVDMIGKNTGLKELLGIRRIREDETTVEGLLLHEGFLLGGEKIYRTKDQEENRKKQDLELTFPWYVLEKDAEMYMCGLPGGTEEEKEYPAIIWGKSYGKASVFAVNGSYMEDATGLGLLSAMASKTEKYEIYPVINAQNMVITNYPGMASENDEETQKRYYSSTQEFARNTVWPSIIAVYRKSSLGLSCMITPQFDYEDENVPNQAELEYYMKRLKEQSAEAGLSCESVSDTSVMQKLREDERFMKDALPDYKFSSFYAGRMEEEEIESVVQEDILKRARTVVTDYDGEDEVIGYLSEYMTRQSVLSDGTKHTYRDDLRMRSVQTALGYSSVSLDMSDVFYPESASDQDVLTETISEFNGNIRNSWKDYPLFSGTTVSECDQRIRNFLAADFACSRDGNSIHMELTGTGMPVWFILRTDYGTVKHIEGGDWKMLEEGVYLIEAEAKQVTIEF